MQGLQTIPGETIPPPSCGVSLQWIFKSFLPRGEAHAPEMGQQRCCCSVREGAQEGKEPPVLKPGCHQSCHTACPPPRGLSQQQLCSPSGGSAGNPSHARGPEGREMQVTAGTELQPGERVPRYLGCDSNSCGHCWKWQSWCFE